MSERERDEWTGTDGDGRPVDMRKCPCCEKPRLMFAMRNMGDQAWVKHPAQWRAAYDAEGKCCNPKCGGRWGTNCWHCHSPRYSSAEEIQETKAAEKLAACLGVTVPKAKAALEDCMKPAPKTYRVKDLRLSWNGIDLTPGIASGEPISIPEDLGAQMAKSALAAREDALKHIGLHEPAETIWHVYHEDDLHRSESGNVEWRPNTKYVFHNNISMHPPESESETQQEECDEIGRWVLNDRGENALRYTGAKFDVKMASAKPCPDCAHTEHPGQYWGAQEAETCGTCGGSAVV